MACQYIAYSRDQLLIPLSLCDWLPENHLAWFLIETVEAINTEPLHRQYVQRGPGRPAYDPDVMLTLLLYAYCTGVRSSRQIEQLCTTDLAYKVISANLVPDHDTIASFRADHEQAIASLFVDVLKLCHVAGLADVGVVAIDGTKMAANASMRANKTSEVIEAEVKGLLAEARQADALEEPLPGFLQQLPTELASRPSRLARLQAALAEVEAIKAAEQAQQAEQVAKSQMAASEGRRRPGAKPQDPQARLARAEIEFQVVQAQTEAKRQRRAELEARAAAEGRQVCGRRPNLDTTKLDQAKAALEAARVAAAAAPAKTYSVNRTDPESRIMMTPTGYTQGFNAQAAGNRNHIVLACDVTKDCTDNRQLIGMMKLVQHNTKQAGIQQEIGPCLADAGYWSPENATAPGPDRLIATRKDWKQRQLAQELGTTSGPPPEGAEPMEAMEHRLRTEEGAALYALRSQTIEPIFGDSKENRGYRRFMRRGHAAAQSEWSLMCTANNLGKLFRACGGRAGLTAILTTPS